MFFCLRLLLLLRLPELAQGSDSADLIASFMIGMRFDLRMAAYGVLPIVFIPLVRSTWYRTSCLWWMSVFATTYLLFGLIEIEFYAEFQQRLNLLILQYLKDDAVTAIAMVWEGLPIMQYIFAWVIVSLMFHWFAHRNLSKMESTSLNVSAKRDGVLCFVLFLTLVISARGTLASGPPLRWGDAYTTDNMFTNQLGLNGNFTFFNALVKLVRDNRTPAWVQAVDPSDAAMRTKAMLATPRKNMTLTTDRPKNVVIVLLESFSGQFVGALNGQYDVTPEFDKLAQEGLLFTRFFSNGTHTHQGTFATFSCFPNIPGHEYLMQQPEGRRQFGSLSRQLSSYDSLYIYNGDFRWDNQYGFFTNQGVDRFIGRYDFVDPIFIDPVWGVSDEDMFNRAEVELLEQSSGKPFVAYLQSLSNHMPYNLPSPLSFDPVSDAGHLSERLTAMKYSDWALGQFFRRIKKTPYYDNTIFVIVGDHGFGTDDQLTEVNLLRFHVPMLILGSDIQPARFSRVGSQVDIIPTILGQVEGESTQPCFGRDLLAIDSTDKGFAIIKASGNEPTTALVEADRILTFDQERGSHLYRYSLFPADVSPMADETSIRQMEERLFAYVRSSFDYLHKVNDSTLPAAAEK